MNSALLYNFFISNFNIEWIEIIFDEKVDRQYLKLGHKPQAEFNINAKDITARAYCNIHGLWIN
jgi:superoxide reductase